MSPSHSVCNGQYWGRNFSSHNIGKPYVDFLLTERLRTIPNYNIVILHIPPLPPSENGRKRGVRGGNQAESGPVGIIESPL